MKTIYTDNHGVLPWAWLILSAGSFALAVQSVGEGSGWRPIIASMCGVLSLALAIRRFLQIRRAKAEGRDHTIVRVKNAPNR